MYGDTTAIRDLALRFRRQAEEVRREADDLRASAVGVAWHGVAADAMRSVARHRAATLEHTADLHDDAARALEEHADEVDRIKRLIALIEQRVLSFLAGVGGLLDPIGDLLHRFVPPPSGHKDWLTVRIPGLDLVHLG